MRRLLTCLAALIVGGSSTAAAQTALTYAFSLTEKVDAGQELSSGRIAISGDSLRMDVHGNSPFSGIIGGAPDESISVISTDTGTAQVLTVINRARKEYVRFHLAVMIAHMHDQMSSAPGVSQLDFTGSSVTVDSLGPGESVAGYKTLHYRVKVVLRLSMTGKPLGGNDVTADYYVAPELEEFSHSGKIFGQLAQDLVMVPGIPTSITEQLEAVEHRMSGALVVKAVVESKSSMFGTGVTRTQTFETSDFQRVTASPLLFTVPAGYTRITRPGLDSAM